MPQNSEKIDYGTFDRKKRDVMIARDCVQECFRLLDQNGQPYVQRCCGHSAPYGDRMLILGAQGGRNNLKAIGMLLSDRDLVSSAAIIARSLFEHSVRILWATMKSNRWDSYELHWADERLKFAGRARRAEWRLDCVEETERQANATITKLRGSNVKAAPNVLEMLKQIEKQWRCEGLETSAAKMAEWRYAYFFGVNSFFTHGLPGTLADEDPAETTKVIGLTCVDATGHLLQALVRQWSDDVKNDIARLDESICSLASHCHPVQYG